MQVCVHVLYIQHNFTASYITSFVRVFCEDEMCKAVYIASFPPPVVDHLQYANIEEEDLGDFITSGYVMCSYVR